MTSKKARKRAAARAAKRIPLVGTTVAILPLAEAWSDTMTLSQIASGAAWSRFLQAIKQRYTGVDSSGNVNGATLVTTYVPIAVYLIARKVGISKPISRVLGHFGLRF